MKFIQSFNFHDIFIFYYLYCFRLKKNIPTHGQKLTKDDYLEWIVDQYFPIAFIQINVNTSIKELSDSKMGTTDEEKKWKEA